MRYRFAFVSVLVLTSACEWIADVEDKAVATGEGGAGGSSADPSAPCSAQPPAYLYCNDFDSVSAVSDTWDWESVGPDSGAATIAFDTTDFQSSPRSAQFLVSAVQGTDAQLGKTLSSLSQQFRLAFDLRLDVDSLEGIAETAIAQVESTSADDLAVAYVVGPGAIATVKMYLRGVASNGVSVPIPPLDKRFHRIVFAYDKTSGMTAFEDGVPLGSDPSFVDGAPGALNVIVGAVFVNPPDGTTTLKYEIDNVVARGN